MELAGCDVLRDATDGCRVVLLAATETEAAPLRAALTDVERHTLATKKLHFGRVLPYRPGAPKVRVVLAESGCDKANAAHILTCLLQAMASSPLVVQVGIAGALLGTGQAAGARVGDVVLATQEIYSDTGSSSPGGWLSAIELGLPIARVGGSELGGVFPLDTRLVQAAAEVVKDVQWSEPASPADVTQEDQGPSGTSTFPAVLMGPCVTSSQVTGLRAEAEAAADRWGALAESMEGAAAAHICALHGAPFLEVRGISNLVTDRDRGAWQVERAVAVAGRAALSIVAAVDQLPLRRGGAL